MLLLLYDHIDIVIVCIVTTTNTTTTTTTTSTTTIVTINGSVIHNIDHNGIVVVFIVVCI